MKRFYHLLNLVITLVLLPLIAFAEGEPKQYSEAELNEEVQKRLQSEIVRLTNTGAVNLSRELLQKEQQLKVKELQIKKLEDEINLTQQTLERRIQDFQKQQEGFLSCVQETDNDQINRVQRMVEAIAGMRPQNAADVLSVQDSEISVQILGSLEPDKVARIFNLMDKEVSARLQKQYLSMKK
jgi:flagellar motility protein MotE (MotC chaperone)